MGKERCSTKEDGGEMRCIKMKEERGGSQYTLHVPHRSASIVPANISRAACLKQECGTKLWFPQRKSGYDEIFLVRMDPTRWPGLKPWLLFTRVRLALPGHRNNSGKSTKHHSLHQKMANQVVYCGMDTLFCISMYFALEQTQTGFTYLLVCCCVQHYFCPLAAKICWLKHF